MIGLFVTGLLSVGGYYVYRELNRAEKLMYNVTGYGFRKGQIVVDFQLTNPTRGNYRMEFIQLDMYAGNTVVAQSRQEQLGDTYVFPAELTTVKPIKFKPLGTAFIGALGKFLLSGQKPPAVKIVGFVKVNGIRLPIDYALNYQA